MFENREIKDEYPMSMNGGDASASTETIVSTTETTQATTNCDEHPTSSSPSSSWLSKYGGIIFSLLASIYFSLTFLDIKVLQKRGFPPFGTAMLFNLGVIIPCVMIISVHEMMIQWKVGNWRPGRKMILSEIWPLTHADKKRTLRFLMLQGALQSMSVVFRSYSLQYLDIGDMTVIVFSSPILTTIIAHFTIGEPCGIIFIIIALYTFCGVVLITKPPLLVGGQEFDSDHLIGIGLAAGALICLSMKFVVTRKIQNSNVFLMTLFLGCCGFIVSLPLYLIFEKWDTIIPNDASTWLLVLGLFGAFLSIACINLALKLENAGPVALVRSLDVLFAFLLQYFFLNVIPDLLSSLGGMIVVSGVLAVGIRKWILSTKYGKVNCCRSS